MAIWKKDKKNPASPKNPWYIDYLVPDEDFPGRKRRKRECIGPNYQQAKEVLAQRIVDRNNGKLRYKRQKHTIKDLIDKYMELHSKPNKETHKNDETTGERILSFFNKGTEEKPEYVEADKITGLMIETMRVELLKPYKNKKGKEKPGLKKSSINRYIAFLKHVFNKAVAYGMYPEDRKNPCSLVSMYEEEGRDQVLEKPDIEKLFAQAETKLAIAMVTGWMACLRTKEVRNLSFERFEKGVYNFIDMENRIIKVYQTKTKKMKTIPINDTLYAFLILAKKTNYNWKYDWCTAFDNAVKRAEVKNFVYHDFRHTFSTFLWRCGVDTYTRSVLMGHTGDKLIEGMEMTSRYTHAEGGPLYGAVKRLDAFCGINSGMEWVKLFIENGAEQNETLQNTQSLV
jgi:integrase